MIKSGESQWVSSWFFLVTSEPILCVTKKIKSHRRNREKQERKMTADDQRFPRISWIAIDPRAVMIAHHVYVHVCVTSRIRSRSAMCRMREMHTFNLFDFDNTTRNKSPVIFVFLLKSRILLRLMREDRKYWSSVASILFCDGGGENSDVVGYAHPLWLTSFLQLCGFSS